MRSPLVPRVLGALTAAYGAYTFARPLSLARLAGLSTADRPRAMRNLGWGIGARDVVSGAAMMLAPAGPALRAALAVRVACDVGDAIGFGVSVPPTCTGAALDYPARYLFRFLAHHGLLELYGSPQRYTVVGGTRTYVEAIGERLTHVRGGRAVSNVLRHDTGVSVQDFLGTRKHYDGIVIATHADQALDLLADASRDEKEILGAFRYSRSETVLHTDASSRTRHAHGPRGTT